MKKATKTALIAALPLAAVTVLAGCASNSTANATAKTAPVTALTDPYNITKVKPAKKVTLDITKSTQTIAGQKLTRYDYTNSAKKYYGAGEPIVIAEQPTTINVKNESGTTTNVHWHGLIVPNSQDGPMTVLKNGASHTFKYTPVETGTYWVHSHYRPVAQQVGEGMLAPLIVKAKSDAKYNLDEVLVLSQLDKTEGMMQMMDGKAIDTINGKTKNGAASLSLSDGQVAKLRLIGAAPDNTETVKFPFKVKVVAIDGYNLTKAYTTNSVTVQPGGRADVEVALSGKTNHTYKIQDGNASLTLNYKGGKKAVAKSPFVPAKAVVLPSNIQSEKPAYNLVLGSKMGKDGFEWTINGQIYPNLPTFKVKTNVYNKIRFTNDSSMGHPMHIHGAHFVCVAINGKPTHSNIEWDTFDVPAHSTADIAIKFTQPGVWMVHCHILSHEDAGMMATFTATK